MSQAVIVGAPRVLIGRCPKVPVGIRLAALGLGVVAEPTGLDAAPVAPGARRCASGSVPASRPAPGGAGD
jgi:hypothetical protein